MHKATMSNNESQDFQLDFGEAVAFCTLHFPANSFSSFRLHPKDPSARVCHPTFRRHTTSTVPRITNGALKAFLYCEHPSYISSMTHRLALIQKQVSNYHPTSKMAVVFDEKTPDINLYTAGTPNGIKISITLEELGYFRPFSCSPSHSAEFHPSNPSYPS